MATSSSLSEPPLVSDSPFNTAAGVDVIVRWITNNRHWTVLIREPNTFANEVVRALSLRGEALTEQRVKAEATRRASAQVHALCASTMRAEQELGYEVLAAYLHRHALRRTNDATLAEDAAQNALRNTFRAFAQARNPQTFIGWCNAVLQHELSRLGRKGANRAARETSIDQDDDDAVGGAARPLEETFVDLRQDSIDDAVAGDLHSSAVWKCLEACHTLTDRARQLIVFLFRDELPYSRIAALWNETVNNLQQIFFRAKKTLKQDRDFLNCLERIGG